jgi:hypothetical protein
MDAVLAWLTKPGASARLLRMKPLVLLWPAARLGEIMWNPQQRTT